jgi:glycogen phosphorylase
MASNSDTTKLRVEEDGIGSTVETLKRSIVNHLYYSQGVPPELARRVDYFLAVAQAVRDRMQDRWIANVRHFAKARRILVYLSAEYLIGPQLQSNLINLGIEAETRQALRELGIDLDELIEEEREPGLGNGGLGRLAACYLDSLATLGIPCIAYGIRYEFGIFEQQIRDGWQVAATDLWLSDGDPWEGQTSKRFTSEVGFEGCTSQYFDAAGGGRVRTRWDPGYVVRGVGYVWPIVGYRKEMANSLRLWRAEATQSFDFKNFDQGDYYGAVEQKVLSENLTKVLYPNDEPAQGKALRLKQQYFLVSCTLQELTRELKTIGVEIEEFHKRYCIQLNDTHPALAVAEMMRLLVDVHELDWDKAWRICCSTFAYTNHTLLPEGLEVWPLPMFEKLLPRHLEIIYEINAGLLDEVRQRFPGDVERVARMSLIDEHGERYVRMANLACVGSRHINGVSELHSQLLKRSLLRDFYELTPDKFGSVTNGVSPRRFLRLCNPGLSALITRYLGDEWICNLQALRRLESFADDAEFRSRWAAVKLDNKRALARYLREFVGVTVDPETMFDIQVKRIHEYKRQLLNVLHVITLFNRIRADPAGMTTPRTCIFGGKAAPGYYMAKLIIKLITSVAKAVNNDKVVAERLKVVFYPNFNIKSSQRVYPSADLSEQISAAGYEASGTGNMKFALNGALTIGTLDGANVEIREAVGHENFFLFGLTVAEIESLRANDYAPRMHYETNAELKAAIDLIDSGFFAPADQPMLFKSVVGSLLHDDHYMVLADYQSYVECQDEVSRAFLDSAHWTRMSILNVARMGWCSSDRAVRDYCRNIWQIGSA